MESNLGVFGNFGNESGEWRQETGQLKLRLQAPLAALDILTLTFTLLNPATGDSSACLRRYLFSGSTYYYVLKARRA